MSQRAWRHTKILRELQRFYGVGSDHYHLIFVIRLFWECWYAVSNARTTKDPVKLPSMNYNLRVVSASARS